MVQASEEVLVDYYLSGDQYEVKPGLSAGVPQEQRFFWGGQGIISARVFLKDLRLHQSCVRSCVMIFRGKESQSVGLQLPFLV